MRVVLRDPELLILDEATANIDTVTEQQLEQILDRLPPNTTKVIIAHRLNTIANADEIFRDLKNPEMASTWHRQAAAMAPGAFTRSVPRVARDEGITLFELLPTDDSLESVFSYLVRR